MKKIFTVGYTTFKIEDFIIVLKKHKISCVIDVRSVPMSQYYVDYNKNYLEEILGEKEILYRNYANEFGAYQTDQQCYSEGGYLDFEKFTKTESFLQGVRKIENGITQKMVFALMCAEKDPINCHRSIMITKKLSELGYNIKHIISKDKIETQQELEIRLLNLYFPDRAQKTLFENNLNDDQLIKQAYQKRNEEIGHKIKSE